METFLFGRVSQVNYINDSSLSPFCTLFPTSSNRTALHYNTGEFNKFEYAPINRGL